MPFIDDKLAPADLVTLPEDDTATLDPTLGQTFAAAFRTENMVGSWLSARGIANPDRVEDGFNAIDYIADESAYAPYARRFAGVRNRQAADALKAQIDRETADRRTIEAAGGMGFVASLAAGVFDLPTLLPLGGGIVAGGGIARTAAGAAIGAGIDATVSETGLQLTQITRTGEESAYNIGGSVLLGGALGTLVGRYMSSASARAVSRRIENSEREFDAFDQAFVAAGQPASAGAAAVDRGPLRLKDEKLFASIPGIRGQDPLIRLQLSELDTARNTVRRMAETPLEYQENAAGVATEIGGSVETRMKMWNAPLADTLRGIDAEFAKYYNATPEPGSFRTAISPMLSEFDAWRGGQRLTAKQFREEVGRAAFSGEQHSIPEVAAAARRYREIDDSMKRAAIDAGLFPEDIKVEGDISHLFRMYNRERIIADRGKFRAILADYFQSAQQAAVFKAEEMRLGQRIVDIERARSRYDQSAERLTSIEERLASRSAIRDRKTADVESNRQLRFDTMKARAPAALVKVLRGADENKAMIDVVREARAANRTQGKKQPMAVRQPVLSMIRQKGGVRIGSVLDGEVRAMGVTPQTHPGLFRKKGGLGDVDNWVKSEDDIFDNLPEDGAGYVDRNALLEAIREELAGNPLRSARAIEDAAVAENLDQLSSEWLSSIGLPANATVKEVRDFIARVMGAERDLSGLDTRISRLESEIEQFDQATDALRNERLVSEAEADRVRKELDDLEAELENVGDLANASPRVGIIVDYARARRDLFKAKLKERTLSKRVASIEQLRKDGRITDELSAELNAKSIELDRVRTDIGKLSANADRLEKMAPKRNELEKTDEFANLSPQEISELADETIDTILGNAEGRVPYDSIVSGPRGPLKERLLRIESAKISDFMELDIERVLAAQVRTMSADVELAKKFGEPTLKEELRKVNDEANRKIAQVDGSDLKEAEKRKRRQDIDAARKAAIRDMEGIRDRLRGQYALPSNPDSLVLRTNRVVRNLNYLRLLGGMTLSAFPDMGKVVFTHGLTSTFRDGFIPLVRNFKRFRLAAEEVKMAGTALDMVLDTRTMAIADITDDFGRHSKIERAVQTASSRFGLVSLMAPWNASVKQFSGLVVMTNALRAAERVAAGKAGKGDVRKLAAAGINEDLARRITEQWKAHGSDADGIALAGGQAWTDRQALEAFRAAVVRDVDRIVVTPGQDKPLWMSTELGKTVGQFKSFAVASMQRTMMSGIQQRDAATLNGVMVMMGLGALTYWAKEKTAGREVSDNPAVWAVNAFDWSGMSGWLMEANGFLEKATRGKLGASMLTGEQLTRFQSRNIYGAIGGPSIDAVADIFQISGSIFAGDTTKADLRKARQLVPMQNLFYLRQLFNQVESGVGDALALPDRRK